MKTRERLNQRTLNLRNYLSKRITVEEYAKREIELNKHIKINEK